MLPMLNTVISSLFKKSATVSYPAEKREQPAGMRGHVINDPEKCIVCNICQLKCPTGAITVNRAERTWSIARFDCIQCGNCVSRCPVKSLTMRPERPETITEKITDTMYVPEATKPKKPLTDA